jgi:hypothetical protein
MYAATTPVKCQLHRPLACFNVLLALATKLSFPLMASGMVEIENVLLGMPLEKLPV